MLFILSSVVIIVILLYCYFRGAFNVWQDMNVAGPRPLPFFGNLKESILRRKNLGMLYKEIYDAFPDEKVIGIYRMTSPTLIIRDLDIIKQILIKDFNVFSDRGLKFSKQGLGDNMFHCDMDIWQGLRQRLTPLFTSGKLKTTVPILNHHADQLINFLDDITSTNEEQEVIHLFRKYTMAIIMSTLFSTNVDFFYENCKAVDKVADDIVRSTYANELDMIWPNVLRKLNMSLYSDSVNKLCYSIARSVNNQRTSVMDALMAMQTDKLKDGVKQDHFDRETSSEVTDHVKAAQVFVLFAAGYVNNSLNMSYALFRLADDFDIQEKLKAEIDDVLQKYSGELTYDAINEMAYLDKVYSEVLRMNTLTPALMRSPNEDYKLPGTNVIVKKGTPVAIPAYAIHRDEKLYADPDKFDPTRFSSENSTNRHPCAFIPFGAGPRSCLGRRLAKLQFMVGIVKILRKYRLETSEKTKRIEDYDPMCTFMATKGGVFIKFIPRKT